MPVSGRSDRNKAAPAALTGQQARAVAKDPRWGATMDADVVDAGAKNYPSLA
jgi:hypothetical protein